MLMTKLINGDCIEELPKLDANSVDLVLVDLPYGQTAAEWDVKIDLDAMWKELKRVGKDNTAYIFFTTTKFGNDLINSNPKLFKYDLVWQKSNIVGFLNANRMPMREHEMIYIFYNKLPIYNPQKTDLDNVRVRPWKNNRNNGVYGKINEYKEDKTYVGVHPKSIIKFNNPPQNKRNHLTEKPVDLLEWLIKSYSNKDGIVLDFTMGSGSTGIACMNTDRGFIGIEKDPDIFNVAEKRIREHKIT